MLSCPIADAHLHVWDPQSHYYPWLCDPQPIPFRYGDYSALRRRYLVDDYRADSAGWAVAHGVYVEAEWDPRDPLGEMHFISEIRRQTRFPTVAVARAWLHHEDCASVLERQAQHSFVRAVRHKPAAGSAKQRVSPATSRKLRSFSTTPVFLPIKNSLVGVKL